jgi:cytosine/adenosine deaminase-related metal-dependent hydrolase
MATADGARACGLDDRVGTLQPGKQADVVLLRTDLPNLAPVADPVAAAVLAAGTGNVDAVLVAGRWVKREGRLLRDPRAVIDRAAASQEQLLSAAGVRDEPWCPPALRSG